ncbi:MAG: DNA mismatch repair endonuclease MutL [Candidatus Eremiobacteraeota bacterium]|nr:DNA mismatch repair endonuclease MutL [Candidatus Eremiobacteraeota bacterium]
MIRLLDEETIGQIAAGEAIERPSSVVKELVENALDAGATRIAVRIRGGGLEEIEVVDDGAGIPPEELSLAVRRHATSKLSSPGDLQRVETLGFRGEGLASIAAVARLTLETRVAGAELGVRLEAHGETVGEVEPVAAPRGTRALGRDLFANVPVRREFLRSAGAEFARISTWLSTLSLAYADVTFSLAHDDRDVWILPGGSGEGTTRSRLAHVFGAKHAAGLVPLRMAPGAHEIGVSGFISAPPSDRPDRRLQVLFVNGRLLRSTLLSGAWTAAYATFATSGRHPYGVIFLSLPPSHVDPNVHPTKTDVRLRYDRAVFETVRGSLATTLRAGAQERLVSSGVAISFAPPQVRGALAQAQSLFSPEAAPSDEPRLRVVAQLDATYILATDGSALVLIDQHAAHERIAYEAIERNAQASNPSEPLLVPAVVELDAALGDRLDDALDILRQGGLEVEAFGERAYRVVATPAGYESRRFDLAAFVRDLDDDRRGLSYKERVWASLACHSVARAGDRLSEIEMTTLASRLQSCRNPMHCPHGRPTVVRLEPEAIARLFART